MILSELTSPQVEVLSREIVCLIPTGATEQHGPHLPIGTDWMLAEAFGKAVEANLPEQVLLVPTLACGVSPHHMAFAGTLSLSPTVYIQAIQEMIGSLVAHGFRRFYILNGHGGNTPANELALRMVKQSHPNCWLAHADYYQVANSDISQLAGGVGMGHADEVETSLMLHCRPELVQTHKLVDDGLEPVPYVSGLITNFNERSLHGVAGNATRASVELGEKLYEAVVGRMVQEVSRFAGTITLLGQPYQG